MPIRNLLLSCVCVLIVCPSLVAQWDPNFSIGTSSGNYAFSYNQVPDPIAILSGPVDGSQDGLVYQWEECIIPAGSFTTAPSGNQPTYSFTQPLMQTTYFHLKVSMNNGLNVVISNVIKIQVVSVNWENLNYIREHDILVPGISDWETADQLPIGQQIVNTSYSDGMGRTIESISIGAATPTSSEPGTWGDIVQFSVFDSYGRQPNLYLSYSTTTQAGKFKSTSLAEQPQYFVNNYNETSAFVAKTFEGSPLNREVNYKSPGTSWAAGSGKSIGYVLNDSSDNVQIFNIGFNTGAVPIDIGQYAANTLYKTIHTDENNKQTIVFTDMEGKVILTKEQLNNNPADVYNGWICTYSVYDDFGNIRYQIQPEGVNWLSANNWTFTAANGQQVLYEYCFRYEYDEKQRAVLKKSPGADYQSMIYDNRDRIAFTQNGNQRAKSPGEWLAILYDDLDRTVFTGLYETAETPAQLQTDIANATTTATTISVPSPTSANLVVTSRISSISQYVASNSVGFEGTFSSNTGDEFETLISPAGTVTGSVEMVVVYNNPISATIINNPTQFTPLKYFYYDNYNFVGVHPFDNGYNNGLAYTSSDPTVLPISASQRTTSFPTGSKVRVLGTSTFLMSTAYFDEKGKAIQASNDNILGGTDITTRQYYFDGRLLSSDLRHTAPGTPYLNFDVLTKYLFDQVGRATSVQKKYGTNPFKTVVTYDMDDIGRLLTRHFDPGYTGTSKDELESLTYSYDIHQKVIGINKDYALKTPGKYDKWGNFFGQYVSFDNRDGVFAAGRLDGKITGALWSTQGDDAQRKYDYSYDNVGRLTNAQYGEKQNLGDSWSNSAMDFSVSGHNGQIQYDLNGNIQYMSQRGVLPGTQSPVTIDDLQYTYNLSNKVSSITDNSNIGTANGQLGDFVAGGNNSSNGGNDYVYDSDGNLVVDLNKNVVGSSGGISNGISYNYLNKPELIQVQGKGTVQIVYDANGNSLQKIFTPQGTNTPTTTSYIQQFIYQGTSLLYIGFEEGRIRVMQSVSQDNGYDILDIDGNIDLPGGQRGAYDYYIRDFQGNERMILTEETDQGSGTCTMELSRSSVEEPLFGQVDANGNPTTDNEVAARFLVANIPGQSSGDGWQNSAIGSYVSRIGTLAGNTMGPNALLRVMAGDQISAQTIYYYQQPTGNVTNSSILSNLLVSLAGALTRTGATTALVNSDAGNIASNLSATLAGNPFLDPGAQNPQTGIQTPPTAFLYVLFFDERMNLLPESSSLQVSQAGTGAAPLILPPIKAPKNGYAFVYVCNASDQMVYFDNLQVTNNHGPIIEEDHYYAYGLKIAAISSQKLPDPSEGSLDNNFLYNGKQLVTDAGLNWYEYGFRNYDPQIARFTQLDPLSSSFPYLTPYQYASGDPILNVDIDGLEGAAASLDGAAPAVVVGRVNFASSVADITVWKAVDFIFSNGTQFLNNFGNNAVIYAYVNQFGQVGWFNKDYGEIDYPGGLHFTQIGSAQISTAPTEAEKAAEAYEELARQLDPQYGAAVGFLEGARDMVLSVLNIFNMDPDQNTLVKTANFLGSTPDQKVYAIYTAISNTDWQDPASLGKAAFTTSTIVVPFVGPELIATDVADVGVIGDATDATSIEAKIGGAAGPGGGEINPFGGETNCGACYVAWEMHMRDGGDYFALDDEPWSTDDVSHAVGGSWETGHNPESIMNAMKQAGPGARGGVFADRGGDQLGHFFGVENKDGIIQFLDFQVKGDPVMNLSTQVYGSYVDWWFINPAGMY